MTELHQSYHDGVQGVLHISSGKPGPILGISACTHGGETVGLEVIQYLMKRLNIEDNLKKGEIYLIISNIQAYEKSIALKYSGDEEYIVKARYIDENMNRCCSVEALGNPMNYERKRANELTGILKRLDYHIDIHSTMTPAGSMLLHTAESKEIFGDVFNTDEIYYNLIDSVVGKPLIDITKRHGGIGIAIETGDQTNEEGYTVGLDNVLRLLEKLEMIEVSEENNPLILPPKANIKYDIIGSIFIKKDTGFHPVKEFRNLDFVHTGEMIAYDTERSYSAPEDVYIIMPSAKHAGEEYCFLAKRLI